MKADLILAGSPAAAPLEPLTVGGVGRLPWQRWLSLSLSLALLVALVALLRQEGLDRLRGALPASPLFWGALAAYYLALPTSEWVIYRRIWGLPPAAFGALLRKLVCNELLVGYSGELSFYLYARRRGRLAASPFQAIKDVSILSAMAGNFATLVMAMIALPVWRSWEPGLFPRGTGISLGLLLALSIGLLMFRRRILSLPAPTLRFIAGVHLARVTATTLLLGIIWHAALPGVPALLWIALAALHLVVTRLPFVPNKDIVFAGAAIAAVGAQTPLAALLALVASLLVSAHVLVGLGLVAADIVGRRGAA